MNLEQIIARQEEEFDKKFGDYGTYNEKHLDALQSEVKFRLKIKDWHSSSIKEILEGVKQELEKLREDYNEEHICRFNDKPQKCDCYGECLTNIINKLKVIIKK